MSPVAALPRAVLLAGLCLAGSWPDAAAQAAEGWAKPTRPTPGPARVHGGPAAGCISGAVALPLDGVGYQVIRVSRNRFWGHPVTVRFVQSLGRSLQQLGLPPIYIGDMAQPRGGPMSFGHASHQNGLDVDIWFSLAPKPPLAPSERENPPLPSLVKDDQLTIDTVRWSPGHAAMLRAAATAPGVDRIFVHWVIKQQLCDTVKGDRSWLNKIRPWWGHSEHFHVRMSCPADSPGCKGQAPNPPGDGCYGEELDWWFKQAAPIDRLARPPATPKPHSPKPPSPRLPAQCSQVLAGR